MERVGFPTPAWSAPTRLDEAQEAARQMGYPVVLGRTHAGVERSAVRWPVQRTSFAIEFEPYRLAKGHTSVLAHDADVALPIVQRYHDLGRSMWSASPAVSMSMVPSSLSAIAAR